MNPTPQNIFTAPMAKEHQDLEKKGHAARLRLVATGLLLAVYSVAFLYPQTAFFLKSGGQMESLAAETARFDQVVLPNLSKERELHKAAYDEEKAKAEAVVNTVFPGDEDKIGLVRRLENFATTVAAKEPPFELNAIAFGEAEKKGGATVLPLSTSIYSSRTNFERFLQLVNMSGLLTSEIPLRLMEISSINIRYRGVDARTGEDQGVDFSVKLNAYSR